MNHSKNREKPRKKSKKSRGNIIHFEESGKNWYQNFQKNVLYKIAIEFFDEIEKPYPPHAKNCF